MKKTYEVNANGNRTFSNGSAAAVARVAVAWRKQGHEPQAYAIFGDGAMTGTASVPVTNVKATAAALAAAEAE